MVVGSNCWAASELGLGSGPCLTLQAGCALLTAVVAAAEGHLCLALGGILGGDLDHSLQPAFLQSQQVCNCHMSATLLMQCMGPSILCNNSYQAA